MSAPSDPCGPAASTSHGPKTDGAASMAAELASVRRRMEMAEPGTISALRVRQKILLHQILASRRSSEVAE